VRSRCLSWAAVDRITLPLEAAADLDSSSGRTLSPWRRARKLLALDRSDLWLCVVYAIAIGLLSLITPIAVQTVVNTVTFTAALQPLIVVTVLVAIGLAFAGVMRVLQAYVVEAIQERMLVRGVIDLSHRVLRTEPSALAARHAPELTHRFFEMPTLQKMAAMVFVDGIELALRLIIGLPLLALYHPLLLAFSLVLLALLGVVVFVFGRGAVVTAIGESTAKYEAASWLEHLTRMPASFRSGAARREAHARADLIARRYRDARRLHFTRLVRHLLGGIGIKVFGAVVLLGVGGMLVIENQMTLGQLVAAELVFASIAAAMLKLHKQLEAAYDLICSAHKLGDLLDLPQEREGGERVVGEGPAGIVVRAATLGYPTHAVASGIELAIRPGERIVVTGASGAGKSTLLEAVAFQAKVLEGTIELDGVDARIANLDDLRDQVVLVREPELVASSVLANLRLTRGESTVREIDEVLRVVGLSDAIARLPEGLQTRLLPSGRPLSRTQVRRLVLARALLARPRVLVLDGALDELGLAPAALERLLEHVLGPEAPWTVVLTSSDPAICRRCDRELLVAGGSVEVSRG
jgi:putative ABC transport system ATP-binding protein